jgi:formate hydrogenlyase transcriptional activator
MWAQTVNTRLEPGDGPQLDTLLASIAVDFAAVASAQVDRAIEEAQRRIVEALGIDGSSLLQFSEREGELVVTNSWVVPVWQKKPRLAGKTDASWSLQKVLRGEVLCLSSLDELPLEAANDAKSFRAMGLKSSLMFPLSAQGKVVGILALDTCREQRQWPAELVRRLRLAAQIFGNVLARKRAEEAEQRTETRYGELLASMGAMLWRADPLTLQTTFVSREAETILGYPLERWAREPRLFVNRIHPEDRDQVMVLSAKAAREKRMHDFDCRLIAAGGQIVRLRNIVDVVVENDETKELVAVAVDITEQKQTEEQRRRSDLLADVVLSSLRDEVVTLDQTGVIVTANEAWFKFARENGASLAAISPGVNYLEVCRRARVSGDPMAGPVLEGIEAVLRGSCEQLSMEYPCESPTSAQWFLMRVTPFRSAGGGVVITHHDATELKKSENSLIMALAEVEQLKEKIHEENAYLRQKVKVLHGHKRVVGQSASIQRALTQVEQVAVTDSTVLLLGETGTGKELLATSIHELSARGNRTMVSVNCAAMPAALVESELFGREKGAFTGSLSRQIGRFELADGSTLFLDEVGELPLETQAKLLRVIQEKQIERLGNPRPIAVDARVIAATNHDLEKAVREGKFREDLYYRLNVFPITVPPLRERREDIPLLVWAFVDEFAKTFNKNIESIERENMDALQRYSWPGNIRELRNIVERAMIISTGPKLRIHLSAAAAPARDEGSSKLVDLEREHILSALRESGWRVRGANGTAAKLGLKPTTLEARMAKLGVNRPTATSES